jgi:hypothetical protein
VLVVVLLIAAAGGTLFALRAAGKGTATGTPAQRWQRAALADFAEVKTVLPTFVQAVNQWGSGSASPADIAGQGELSARAFANTRDALAKQATFPSAPEALANYLAAADLYVASGRITAQAEVVPVGPPQTQAALVVRRLRLLGDRVFDQATEALRPYLPDATTSPMSLTGLAEVPDWAKIGLGAGPPLAAAAVESGVSPASKVGEAPTGFTAWAATVRLAGIPAPDAEARAIEHGSIAGLDSVAGQFTAAANELAVTPTPGADHLAAVRLQLGLLIQAEATRVAQLSELAGPGGEGLRSIARTLAALGDTMWDTRLGPRSTGYPAALLTAPV